MFIILFGVTGSGKTTIGKRLAGELNWQFFDADDFHPAANVEKMRQGIPLNEADREPWLQRLRELASDCVSQGKSAVLACSALREAYRLFLQTDDSVKFVFLKGDFDLIKGRLSKRVGHYMNPNLLQSQFDALEEPTAGIVVVDISPDPDSIVKEIRKQLAI